MGHAEFTRGKIRGKGAQRKGVCTLAQFSIKNKPFRLSHYHISRKVINAQGKRQGKGSARGMGSGGHL
jgi:hypothetical protein